jgi:hypothetical protein
VLLTTRYDDERVLQVEGRTGDPTTAFLRQRRRSADVLARLGAEQWVTPAPPDAVVIAGRAADLADALGLRTSMAVEVPAAEQWLLGGLAAAFDVPGAEVRAW